MKKSFILYSFVFICFFMISCLLFLVSCNINPTTPDKTDDSGADRISPFICIGELFDGEEVGTNLTVSGLAGDNNALEGVYFALDSNSFQSLVFLPYNSNSLTNSWSTNIVLAEGERFIYVYSKDISGLISPITSVRVIASADPDRIPPETTIVSPFGADPVGFQFSIIGTASDNLGLEGVYLSLGGKPFEKLAELSNWMYNAAVQRAGFYSIRVYARDVAGNHSLTNSRGVYVDPNVPVVSIASPTNYHILRETNFILSGTVTAINPLEGVYCVVETNASVKAAGLSNWACPVSLPFVSGLYTIQVFARDIYTNQSPSSQIKVRLDVTPPAFTVIAPTNNQKLLNSAFSIYGQAVDNNTPLSLSSVYYSLNSSSFQKLSVDSGGNWSVNVDLTNGFYTLQAFAMDRVSNNSATNSITFEVRADLTPPFALATNFLDGDILENPISVSGISTDDTEVAAIYISIDGEAAFHPLGISNWSTSNLILPEGSHQISYYAQDIYGRLSGPKSFNIIVDGLAPTNFGLDGSGVYNNTNAYITGYASDIGQIAGVYAALEGGEFLLAGGVYPLENVSWNLPIDLSIGYTNLLIYAVDFLGHVSLTNTNRILVDIGKPSNEILTPDYTIAASSFDLTGIFQDDFSVYYLLLELDTNHIYQLVTAADSTTNTNWSTSFEIGSGIGQLPLAEGTNELKVYGFDRAFNASGTNLLHVILDRTPPSLYNISLTNQQIVSSNFNLTGSVFDHYGVEGVYIGVDNPADFGRAELPLNTFSTNLTLSMGEHLIYLFARDNVGNSSVTNIMTNVVE
jgi:hypothetical protein